MMCDEQVAATSGALTEQSPFDDYATATNVGAIPDGVWDNVFTTGGAAIQDGDGMCAVRGIAGNQTEAADDYTNTLYFRAVATY